MLCLAYADVDKEIAKLWLPPKEAIKYIFNVRAKHKGLMGHFSRVKGVPKKITKKMEKEYAEKTPFKWGEEYQVFESKRVNKGWNWEGDLVLPLWSKYRLKKYPDFVTQILLGNKIEIEAHNAFFEKAVWENVCVPKYGFPKLSDDVWSCSAALAATRALPRALDKVGETLNLPVKKSSEGKLVMMQLARPDSISGKFLNDCKKSTVLFNYCIDDVRAEREISRKLGHMSAYERRVWLLDQKINKKGVPLDNELIEGAIKIIETYTKVLEDEMSTVTGGRLNNIRQTAALQMWLEENGVLVDNVQKGTVEEILQRPNLPDNVRRVLEIRRALGQTSTSKYYAMKSFLSEDHTAKDQFLYSGASTLRWSGKGIQFQNLPRGTLKATEEMYSAIKSGSWRVVRLYGDVMDVLASCLRGVATAELDMTFIDSDFSNIEGRILAWVAKETWKVKAFSDFDKGKGWDLYVLAIAKAIGINPDEVDADGRQRGKVIELALGYQGGLGAFVNMAKIYGLVMPDNEAQELINAWRASNPMIAAFWPAMETAAKKAIATGEEIRVNEYVSFVVVNDFLEMRTIAGSTLYYYQPRLEEVETRFGSKKLAVTFTGVNSVTRKTERQSTYGGKLTENLVQHLARMVLCDAMLRLDDHGFDIRMHVHDQVVSQVPVNDNVLNVELYDTIMQTTPDWCPDLPLAAKGEVIKRFKKG